MAEKETQIGRANMNQAPQKPISFKLKDKSVKTKHLDDKAVTKETIADGAVDNQQLAERSVSWDKADDNLKNIITTSGGQHGIPLATEFGDSNILGITQKTLSEAIGDVHRDGDDYISIQYQIDQIVNDKAEVNLTATPNSVFVGVQSDISLVTTTNTQATSIKIFKNGTLSPIATGSGTSLSYTDSITPATRGNSQYYAEFKISGLTKRYPTNGFVNVLAVDKVYTGAGTTYNSGSLVAEITPHAAGSFNKQITTADGDYLFIEIPDNFNLTSIKLVSTYETSLGFTQIESTRDGYKAYKNNDARSAGTYTYKFTIANA